MFLRPPVPPGYGLDCRSFLKKEEIVSEFDSFLCYNSLSITSTMNL